MRKHTLGLIMILPLLIPVLWGLGSIFSALFSADEPLVILVVLGVVAYATIAIALIFHD